MDDLKISPATRLMSQVGVFINKYREYLTWGAGLTTDSLLLYQGHIQNGYILYGAGAALAGNLIMLAGKSCETFMDGEKGKIWKERAKYIAAPIHHTSGPALMCSGFNLGHTGLSAAEIGLGLCSLSGSVMQFWEGSVLRTTGLDKIDWVRKQGSGKLATYCYSPEIIAVFQDAWRLQSLPLVGVGVFSSTVIALLFTRPDQPKHGLTSALNKPSGISDEAGPI